MLSKKELNLLKGLLEKEDLKAKRKLEDFIWRNTVQPKYQVGDIVKFNDFRQYHFGVHPVGWVGVITGVKYWYDWNNQRVIQYEISYKSQVRNDNFKTDNPNNVNEHKTFQIEKDIISKCRIERINMIDKPRDKYSDCIHL